MIGVSYWESGDDKKALKYLDKAAETAELPMLLDIATHLYEANKTKDADRFVEKAKQRDPEHPMPYVIKGINLLGLGNPFAMLMGLNKGNLNKAREELAAAEARMTGRAEYRDILPTIRQLRQSLEAGQVPGLGGLLGGRGGFGPPPPFMFEDDDEDFEDFDEDEEDFDPFFEPPQPKKKAKKAKKKKR
jgi:tetratricopeptide (TPR) repeat protein